MVAYSAVNAMRRDPTADLLLTHDVLVGLTGRTIDPHRLASILDAWNARLALAATLTVCGILYGLPASAIPCVSLIEARGWRWRALRGLIERRLSLAVERSEYWRKLMLWWAIDDTSRALAYLLRWSRAAWGRPRGGSAAGAI
jgi:hypothetical protein